MNKDQIIQMAREAGLIHETHEGNWHLEQFAKLIRAVTKEEDAKICEGLWPIDNSIFDECARAIRASK